MEIDLERCTKGGYLDFIGSCGRYDDSLEHVIEEARKSIEQASQDTLAKTNRALFAIKSKGIP